VPCPALACQRTAPCSPCLFLLLLQVRVVRGGVEVTLSCFDLLVGDVLLVEAGTSCLRTVCSLRGGPLR